MTYEASRTEDRRHPLDCFFAPRAAAVIGASERPGSVGRTIFWNLISSPFGGTVYAVNPQRPRVLGIRTLSHVSEAPEALDLALIVLPAANVPRALDECAAAGVKGAIVISGDIPGSGAPAPALGDHIRRRAQDGAMRIIGPNSMGVMNPIRGLNAAYASTIALKGAVGFISQSGAVSASILDWSLRVNMGFSAFASFGEMVDVGWSDMLYYLGSDPNTKSIVIYMESLGNARSFLSAAREVALAKPIILLKTGQANAEPRAARASTHGDVADTADDAVLSAALLRSGVLRVDSVDTLFFMAETLGKQPRPRGPRLAIVSNAAGPAALAADALMDAGGELASFSERTLTSLKEAVSGCGNPGNPVELPADAGAESYANAAVAAAGDENTDGVLVLLAPQVNSDPLGAARAIAVGDYGRTPLLASWMGGEMVAEGISILNDHSIPAFPYPDQAARIFASMWRYSYAVRGLYETPEPEYGGDASIEERRAVSIMIQESRRADENILTEMQARQVLAAYRIPVVPMRLVFTREEALAAAATLGYPLWMVPNLPDAAPRPLEFSAKMAASDKETAACFDALAAVRRATSFEGVTMRPFPREGGLQLSLVGKADPQFGPYIAVRQGGPGRWMARDGACALPPLNTTLARRTLERAHLVEVLQAQGAAMMDGCALLDQILVRFSNLVLAETWIREIEVDPLLMTENNITALGARISLYNQNLALENLPQPAIRPYPVEYVRKCTLPDGQRLVLRPIRPEDETMMVSFHKTLSSETVYFRYLHLLSLDQRIRHDRMSQMCFIDYDKQMGLVAEGADPTSGDQAILAIGRLVRIYGTAEADFAIVVNDVAQGRGLGELLLRHLLEVAAAERIERVVGIIHPENKFMLRLCAKLGFALNKPVGEEVRAEYETAWRT